MRRRARELLGALARSVLGLESAWFRGGAIPLRLVVMTRRLARGADPLVPPLSAVKSTSLALRHPGLRVALADQELGAWALGARTINWLERRLGDTRPGLVLEFGSGSSTLCLARFLVDLHGPRPELRVVSIDQDESFAVQTRELVRRNGLEPYVTVLSTSLSKQQIEGVTRTCYDLPPGLADVLAGRKVDFIMIDGPAAEDGARFGTLALARPFAADAARFVLDDGLRDGEIWVARQWDRLGGVHVDGIINLDKGLVVGELAG